MQREPLIIYGQVYLIVNRISGKMYVGQTTQTLAKRWARHVGNRNHHARRMPIADAIARHGKEAFAIWSLDFAFSQAALDEKEVYWVTTLNTFVPNGYNLRAGEGKGRISEITRQRIASANTGKKATPELRARLSAIHKGHHHTEQTRMKLSAAFKGKPIPQHVRDASSKASAKTYHLVNPNGEMVTIVNMKTWCATHGYHKSRMCELVRGKRQVYRGWTRPPFPYANAEEAMDDCPF